MQDTQRDHTTKKTSPRTVETVENYRLLHQAMLKSSANHAAVIAVAGVAMAQAQGKIRPGVYARRQTMLAMAQALQSAGHVVIPATLGTMFSEMRRAGVFRVTRSPGAGEKGGINDVVLVKNVRKGRNRREVEEGFTLAWRPDDVERFPTLRMSQTPMSMEHPAEDEDDAFAAAEDEAGTHMANDLEMEDSSERSGPTPTASRGDGTLRSFWVDDRAEEAEGIFP